jgi:ketosteroid isomerase-like protein
MTSSAQEQANLELARRGIEAFGRGDMETVLGVLAEDVTVFSSPELMNAGTYEGHAGFLHWTREWTDAWEELAMDVISVEPVGERHVVAGVNQRARGRGGIEVELEVAFLFEADGRRCVHLALLPSRESATELAREREAG